MCNSMPTIAASLLLILTASLAFGQTTKEEMQNAVAPLPGLAAGLDPSPEATQVQADVDALILSVDALPDADPDPDPDPDPLPGDTLLVTTDTTLTGTVTHQTIHVMGATLTLQEPFEWLMPGVPIDTNADPQQIGHGLIVDNGHLATLNTSQRTPYLPCTDSLSAGSTTLTLTAVPVGWQVGDTLAVVGSDQRVTGSNAVKRPGNFKSHTELVSLVSISGAQVTFTPPLVHPHPAGIRGTDVANLTRGIRFVADPDHPGHTILMNGSSCDIDGIEHVNWGRTSARQVPTIHPTLPDGTPTPADQKNGRFGFHTHLLGNSPVSVTGCTWLAPRKAGMWIHNTDNAIIRDCVVVHAEGTGYSVAGQFSQGNLFERCLAAGTSNDSLRNEDKGGVDDNTDIGDGRPDTAYCRHGFWSPHMGSASFIDCVAADCAFSAFEINGYAFTFSGGPGHTPPGLFDGNEVYGSANGLWVTWPYGVSNAELPNQPRQVVDEFDCWNMFRSGVFVYHTTSHTFNDCRLVNDPAVSALSVAHSANPFSRINQGFEAQDSYKAGGVVFNNCEVAGWNIGVTVPWHCDPTNTFDMSGGRLSNFVNVACPQSRIYDRAATFSQVLWEQSGTKPAAWADPLPTTPLDVWMLLHGSNQESVTNGTVQSHLTLNGYGSQNLTVHHLEWPTPPCTTEVPLIKGYTCQISQP